MIELKRTALEKLLLEYNSLNKKKISDSSEKIIVLRDFVFYYIFCKF